MRQALSLGLDRQDLPRRPVQSHPEGHASSAALSVLALTVLACETHRERSASDGARDEALRGSGKGHMAESVVARLLCTGCACSVDEVMPLEVAVWMRALPIAERVQHEDCVPKTPGLRTEWMLVYAREAV